MQKLASGIEVLYNHDYAVEQQKQHDILWINTFIIMFKNIKFTLSKARPRFKRTYNTVNLTIVCFEDLE